MASAMLALGAMTPTATRGEPIVKADVLVVVKRADDAHVKAARKRGMPVVYDPLDFWPQTGNTWPRDRLISWARREIAKLAPDALVLPTQRMADDIAFGGPTLVLPHHARPSQATNPIRESVQRIGYEGSAHYLGRWRAEMGEYAIRHGWEVVINPKRLADIDIIVAGRDGQSRGYATDHWKSGVKLANAMATGTPIVCIREAGYMEIASGGEHWVDRPQDLRHALDGLTPRGERHRMHVLLTAGAEKVALPRLARTYLTWLEKIAA